MATLIASYSESNYDNGYTVYPTDPEFAQSFPAIATYTTLDSAKFYIRRIGSLTGNCYAKLYDHTGTYGSGGKPTGAALATSDAIDVSTISTTFALVTFTFSGANRVTLVDGTYYCIAFESNNGTGLSLGITIGSDASSPTYDGNAAYYESGAWNALTSDLCFYVYGVAPTQSTEWYMELI